VTGVQTCALPILTTIVVFPVAIGGHQPPEPDVGGVDQGGPVPRLAGSEARDRATLIYATYVGFWRLVASDSNWEYNDRRHLHRMVDQIQATLIPAPGEPSDGP